MRPRAGTENMAGTVAKASPETTCGGYGVGSGEWEARVKSGEWEWGVVVGVEMI
jgi:hypothetical protein